MLLPLVAPLEPDVPLVEPVVPDALLLEPLPMWALVSMNRSLALEVLEVEVLPEVPVVPEDDSARCRQPVTVIVFALLCRDVLDCDEDVCAPTPPVSASAAAATPPIHTVRFI